MNRREFLASAAGSAAAIGLVPVVPQVLLQACESTLGKHDGNVLVVLQLTVVKARKLIKPDVRKRGRETSRYY